MDTIGRRIWYFADPMCSWCYGFGPVLESLQRQYPYIEIVPVMGGLRPHTKDAIGAALREEILHHWHEVQQLTGMPFQFEGALPEHFVYDTEPAARAVVSMKVLYPKYTLDYLHALQKAFYQHGADITQTVELTRLAQSFVDNEKAFHDYFTSSEAELRTRHDFEITAGFRIHGFPALTGESNLGFTMLSRGYLPIDLIVQNIGAWLNQAPRNS